MARQFCIPLLCAFLLSGGCNGNYREALAVASMAGTLTVLQSVRARANPPSGPCNLYCDGCTYACGNQCVPYGTLCYDPPGRACNGKADARECDKWSSGPGVGFSDYTRQYYLTIPVQ